MPTAVGRRHIKSSCKALGLPTSIRSRSTRTPRMQALTATSSLLIPICTRISTHSMNQQNRGNSPISLSSCHSISHTHTLRTLKTINHRVAHLQRLHISPHLMSLARPLLRLSRNYLMCQSQGCSPLIPVFSKLSGSAITELSSNTASSASCTSSASAYTLPCSTYSRWSPGGLVESRWTPPGMYLIDHICYDITWTPPGVHWDSTWTPSGVHWDST